jgi:PAS domain S-box-containing protein
MPLPDDSVLEAAGETHRELEVLRGALAQERDRYRALESRVLERALELSEAKDDLLAREQQARSDALGLLAQLVEERARLQAVVQQMPAGVLIAEAPSGRIVIANTRAAEIIGGPVRANEVDAYGVFTGLHADGRQYEPGESPLARSIQTGETITGEEIAVLRSDGTLATISVSATPIRARDGSVIAAVAIFHDITERKRVEERDRFLSEAGEILSSSLDADEILTTLAELAVPRLADLCTIAVRVDGGAILDYAPVSAESGAAGNARRDPPAVRDAERIPTPFRTAESEVHPDVDDAVLRAVARDAAEVETLRRLGPRSYMCVPLVARGGVVAAMSFFTAESGRRYTHEDVSFAEDLARRAALAVENARLYARLESERDRLRRLLERLRQGVVTVGRDLCIQFINEEARHTLGLENVAEGDTLPEPWDEFSLRAFAASLLDSADAVDRRVTLGEKTYVVVGVPSQESESAVLVFNDVSEREALERAEREFVTNAAHELRTPLAAMTTSIEVLQAGAKEKPGERDLFLSHIERECARLRRLARALLVLARAQTGQESPQRRSVEVRSILEEVRAGVETDAVGVEVDCPRELTVAADRDLLEQAVWNLGINAAKHSNGGRVLLTGRAVGLGVEIEVRDEGSGIPFAERKRVFERFYRSGERDREGFGLGLAIVQQAVQALGGSVEITGVTGGGTSARVTLPVHPEST